MPHSFGLLTSIEKKLIQTSKSSSIKMKLSHFLCPKRSDTLSSAASVIIIQPLIQVTELTIEHAHHSTSQTSQAWDGIRTYAE